MNPRKPNTRTSFGNCNYDYGIEYAITKQNDHIIEAIKDLESTTNGHEYEGSSNQFLSETTTGRDQTGENDNRCFVRLPLICNSCSSTNICYERVGVEGYRKKEPSNLRALD